MKQVKAITPGKIISQRFVISKKLGEGSFGSVFQGYDIQQGQDVAIKIEEFAKIDEKINKESLLKEAKFLYELKGERGIPQMIYFVKTETKRILVMSLLGSNLETLFQANGRKFSLQSVLSIADQILSRLEQIHQKDIIHRDLKPENFLISSDPSDDFIYLVDFGLSKKFKAKGIHIPYKQSVGLVGTARYASLNAHRGNDQSRRDDLESLGYILIYFLKGHLPWMNLIANTKEEKHRLIIEKKAKTSSAKLCEGVPFEFEQYLNYVRNLKFDEEPNYSFLKSLFRKVCARNNFEYGFDWQKHENLKDSCSSERDISDNSDISHNSDMKKNIFKKERHVKIYKNHSFHNPSCFNPRISKYSDFAKTIIKLEEEEDVDDEENKCEELGISKGFSSKTNNHQNQTNIIDEKEFDNLQLLEEFNVGYDENVTLFTKLHYMELNPFEKKCLGDLNQKSFNRTVTFSLYIKDEENFKIEKTNEYSSRTVKLIDRISLLQTNEIKKHQEF